MDFTQTELNEGVRFVWNSVPASKQIMKQNMIPFGLFCSPFFHRDPPIERRMGAPLKCAKCTFAANPFCALDYYNTKSWICCNCGHRNPLSHQVVNYLTQGGRLQEFENNSTVFEYKLDSKTYQRTVILLLDTSLELDELEKMKAGILESLSCEKGEFNLGIVTFGKHVKLHNLVSETRQELVLDGQKEYSREQLMSLLSLRESLPHTAPNLLNKFIQPAQKCWGRVIKIISRLKPSSFEITVKGEHKRKLRCTGNALQIGVVLASTFCGHGTKITTFLGGACTFGPGLIVTPELEEHFRSHGDLEKSASKLSTFKKAEKFYTELGEICEKFNITLDLFAFCLNQYGLGEMCNLVQRTGGIVINHEEFQDKEYLPSVKQYMDTLFSQDTVWNARTQVLCSAELGLHGALGSMKLINSDKELEKMDNLIGQTGGNKFYLGNTSVHNSFLFLFQPKNPEISIKAKPCYFQFQSVFTDQDGSSIMRVATFSRNFCSDLAILGRSIDQEAAIACIARIASFKSITLQTTDVVYWLNTVLIKFLRRVSTFNKNQPQSLKIPNHVSLLPQFIFYFRKSEFVQKFATSVDEFALFRLSLMREVLNNMLVMIQPSLFAYTLENSNASPVLCDMDSLADDRILVVDTYFFVLIWYGKTIHYWKEQNFQEDPQFAHFKDLLSVAKTDAQLLMEDRLPVPRFIECHPGAPFERVLKSKLNPRAAKTQEDSDENYSTDDVNLKTFMDYLVKLVVKSD